VTIGNPGNPNNRNGCGRVPYVYQMGIYDISQNQINAAANAGLPGMPTGDWTGDQPATSITWYQAAAFVNWLNTSEGYAPAYNLSYDENNGYSMALWPTNQAWTNGGTNLYRSANCRYFLPSANEWYKAAYYDPSRNRGKGGYWLYPTGRDSAPRAVASGTAANTVVYNQSEAQGPASVYEAGGLSPYGTMGQGGNICKWMETAHAGSNTDPAANRIIALGAWYGGDDFKLVDGLSAYIPAPQGFGVPMGFRVARILP
jgi:sulfatase modifying factor 1